MQNPAKITHRQGVVLVGLMGSGKSSVGKVLAQRLDCEYWDSDEELRGVGQSAVAIGHEEGGTALHRREAADLIAAMSSGTYGVFGAAGSTVLDAAAVAELHHYWVVWLRVPVATLAERLQRDPGDRPFVESNLEQTLSEMSRTRASLYAAVADQIVDADTLPPAVIAEAIATSLPEEVVALIKP